IVYASLPPPLAREYHAALADALERRDGAATKDLSSLDAALPVALANHFLRGGQGPRALRYRAAALSHLARSWQSGALADLARRYLSEKELVTGSDRVDLLLTLSEHLDLLGRRAEQGDVLAEAVRPADPGGAAGPRGEGRERARERAPDARSLRGGPRPRRARARRRAAGRRPPGRGDGARDPRDRAPAARSPRRSARAARKGSRGGARRRGPSHRGAR